MLAEKENKLFVIPSEGAVATESRDLKCQIPRLRAHGHFARNDKRATKLDTRYKILDTKMGG